jgi:beta-galactosidase
VQVAGTPEPPPDESLWKPTLGRVEGSADSVWFTQSFSCPGEWGDGRRVFLDFERTEGDSILFLNGRRVAELLAPGGEIEITSAVAFGKDNQLTVFNTRAYVGISRTFEQDLLRHAVRAARTAIPMKEWGRGITAPVTLRSRPQQAVTDVFVVPSWRQKKLGMEVEVDATTPLVNAVINVVVRDAGGKTALSFKSSPFVLPAGRTVQKLEAAWSDPITWELDKPYLYQTEVSLIADGDVVDRFPANSFGFREVWTEGRELLLNGHPIRLRLTDLYGASANALSFYRLMGYNAGQIQPHAKLWWSVWDDTPLLDETLITEADRLGFALTVPGPSVSSLGPALLTNKPLREAYEREFRRFARKYRSHPSILAWAVGMNSYNPQSNIFPATLGRRETALPERGKVIEEACEIAHAVDPNRLAFSHADGSIGDISSANVYLNFAPLQEREEWPMAWAQDGDMPYSAVEFGEPFTANFWKGNQFFMTEYLAMYFGDLAYEMETEAGLSALTDIGLANKRGFGAWGKVDTSMFPAYWKFQDLFVTNTTRAWRTWGVNAGWLPWLLDVGYGDPTTTNQKMGFLTRYKKLPTPVLEKPEWANPNFDIYRKSNQPLLAYIAGGGTHTDKTHAFYVGESFEKQIALVWDGATAKDISVSWSLDVGGQSEHQASKTLTLAPGAIVLMPIKLVAPAKDAVLSLRVTEAGHEIATDTFAIQTFKRPAAVDLGALRVAVMDPQGKTLPWLRSVGVKPIAWQPGSSLKGVDVLLLGRESLKPGDSLPYTEADIARGLRVVIFEQQPSVWEILGFKTVETLPRYTFIADRVGQILQGLRPEDLINWRGSPDLLPEGRQVRTYDDQVAPRWTNRHAVASVALKIPEVVGFTPILKTEFDLGYSPLLEWRHGRGVVYFSSLDLSERVGTDPAATRLACNLLAALADQLPITRHVYYVGGAEGASLLSSLQVEPTRGLPPVDDKGGLLVLDGNGDKSVDREMISDFIHHGGIVLHLPQTGEILRQEGFAAEARSLVRVPSEVVSLLRSIGPELLRWRDALPVQMLAATGQPAGSTVLAGGILLERAVGLVGGREVLLQVSPRMLAQRYLNEPDKRESVQQSVTRLQQLTAQVLTNLGAESSSVLANRVCHLGRIVTYQPLGGWHVLGPWKSGLTKSTDLLSKVWPGEAEAISGDDNPNAVFRREDGAQLDWRRILDADQSGYIDMGRELQAGEGSVVYAQRKITSVKNRMVRLRIGADYWIRLWVNGRLLLDVTEGHGAPKPAAFLVDVPLRAGENVLTLKVSGGSKGFGFWADLGGLGSNQGQGDVGDTMPKADYYNRPFKAFNPYQFHFW